MSNLIEHNGIYYSESTPAIVQEVIEDCIDRKVLVHILTGNPLTGIITPNLNSIGVIELSSGRRPMPILNYRMMYTPEGTRVDGCQEHISWIKTNKILKIAEVDSCNLLYQSYECQSSPLKYIHEVEITPYGDISEKTKIKCENPEIELLVPPDTDVKALCQFLFGQIHHLPDCVDKLTQTERS